MIIQKMRREMKRFLNGLIEVKGKMMDIFIVYSLYSLRIESDYEVKSRETSQKGIFTGQTGQEFMDIESSTKLSKEDLMCLILVNIDYSTLHSASLKRIKLISNCTTSDSILIQIKMICK